MAQMRPAPLRLVLGMIETKAVEDYLAPFATLADGAFTVPVPDSAAGIPADTLAGRAAAAGLPARPAADALAAIRAIAEDGADAPPRVVICGSLYLAGALLRENG
jgi:dihydrofolate synthase/folylpolyglutamate synthase